MQFQKGKSGNPAGRPRGSFGLASLLAAEELELDAYAIIRSTIEAAKQGNVGAQRICWQRLDPVPKGSAVLCSLPRLRKPSDSSAVIAGILAAVAAGQLSIEQGTEMTKLVESYVRMYQAAGEPDGGGLPMAAPMPEHLHEVQASASDTAQTCPATP